MTKPTGTKGKRSNRAHAKPTPTGDTFRGAREIRRRRLDELRDSDRNAKRHPDDQIARLADSIRRFGFVDPILVDPSGEIIAGHARARAARLAGVLEVPTIEIAHLTENEVRALRVAVNRIGELGSWDVEALLAEARALAGDGIGTDALGFTFDELERLADANLRELEGLSADGARDEAGDADQVEPEPAAVDEPKDDDRPQFARYFDGADPVVAAGDVWTIGAHRLFVGDCTKPESVAAVMGSGETVDTILADPPYCSGGNREADAAAGTWGRIASDNLSSRGYQALIGRMLTAARPLVAYVFTDWRMWPRLCDELETAGLPVRAMVVWDKLTPAHGAAWRAQHELVAFASRQGLRRLKGRDTGGNVIGCRRSGNRNHYTEKPLPLLEKLLTGDVNCGRMGAVLDPFAGSGSSLIAAHRVGRVGRGIEIEPTFAEVAVLRLAEELKVDAVRQDGRTLTELRSQARARRG